MEIPFFSNNKRCVSGLMSAGDNVRKFSLLIKLNEFLQQLDGYVPGQDYPIYSEVPRGLSFRCDQRLPGYYSDPEAQCQVKKIYQRL